MDETRVYRRREARSLKNVFQSRGAPSPEDDEEGEEGVAAEGGAAVDAWVDALLTEHAFWRGVDRVFDWCCFVAVAFNIVDRSSAAAGCWVMLLLHVDFVLASRLWCAFCGLAWDCCLLEGNGVAAEQGPEKMNGVSVEEEDSLLPSTEVRIGAFNAVMCIATVFYVICFS